MFKKISSVLLLLFIVNVANAQELKTENTVGSNYVFHSSVTGDEQQLQVYLPENYSENKTTKYPVLYLLDGQNWYTSAVSLSKVFTGNETDFKSIPDFIVVGITTNWDNRREFFGTGNKKNAINFIENDVIAFVDENFRTSKERILFGWQFTGGFVINTLAEKPALFTGYLAATPVFFDPNVIDTLLSEDYKLKNFLFVAGTKEEKGTWVKPMVNILKEKAPDSFNWTYKEIAAYGAFGHRISPLETLSYGLRAYFSDYPNLEFRNVDDFYASGGLKYVKSFYEERGERYGVSKDIGHRGRYLLVRLAIRENHYPTFELLMNEFKGSGFIESLATWQTLTCANIYLTNNKPNEAVALYSLIVKNDPENVRAINGIGKAFLEKGEHNKAVEFLKRAVELAKNTGDENLDSYKADLDKASK